MPSIATYQIPGSPSIRDKDLKGISAPIEEVTTTNPRLVPGHVYDAGGSGLQDMMEKLLHERLLWANGPYNIGMGPYRLLPTPVRHDTTGLELWDHITQLSSYYQTDSKIELFQQRGFEITNFIQPSTALIDLGCGNVHKIKPLLDYLEYLEKPMIYFAIDLDRNSLLRAMATLQGAYKHIKCFGLWGTFDSGLVFLNTLGLSDRPRLFLSLGSMFGNDFFHLAVARLRKWKAKALCRSTDMMLLTMDGTANEKVIWNSYHDSHGLFEHFVRNGYRASNQILEVVSGRTK